MTDHPASWLADPTGRHDHRYWDGTHWTDHVADAGVAATDLYDGPADAAPEAPSVTTPASPSGWATTTEPAATGEPEPAEPSPADGTTSSMSGWGDTSADAATAEPEAGAPANAWATPTTSAWGIAPAEDAETTVDGAEATTAEATTVEPEPLVAGSYWGTTPSTVHGDDEALADVGEDATEVGDAPVARWGAGGTEVASTTWDTSTTTAPTSTWGQPISTEPIPAGAPTAEPPGGGSRKRVLVVVALAAVVAVVVALVVMGDDDGGGGGGDSVATQLADQLQDRTSVSDDQADCVGDYVVDEIGESRIESIKDLEDRTAPPELQEDFDRAVQRAITECDVDQADLVAPGIRAGGTEGAADSAATDSAASNEVFTESQYTAYYKEALGVSDEDAACLARHSTEAEASGAIDQGDGVSQFYDWVDDCGIDPDELFQTIATADSGSSTG